MMFALVGSITMQEMARLAMKSFSGNHAAPLLVVFQTPPSTPPHHMMLVDVGCTRIARTRPPILPGPSQVQPFVGRPAAGNWLSLKQAQTLLNAPDISTLKGLRDRAIIAVLLGCALRRSEVAALTMAHIQQRDGRWCIVDLYGKHGRVRRTIPMPAWVKVAIDAWTAPAGVVDGYVFRPVVRGDQMRGDALSEKVVWQMLRPYAEAAGVPGIAPDIGT